MFFFTSVYLEKQIILLGYVFLHIPGISNRLLNSTFPLGTIHYRLQLLLSFYPLDYFLHFYILDLCIYTFHNTAFIFSFFTTKRVNHLVLFFISYLDISVH